MAIVKSIVAEIRSLGRAEYAGHHRQYFQCFEGGYGDAGDEFFGTRMPDIRCIVKKYLGDISYGELEELVSHNVHEVRMLAACAMAGMYELGDESARKKIVDFYLKHARYLNNWDLVDAACHKILGRWCHDHGDYGILRRMRDSKNLWEQRIAIVSTWWPLRNGEFGPTIEMAAKSLCHRHDLIHKAAGWMLREMGKRGAAGHRALIGFLDANAGTMPRTTLRYATERMPAGLRRRYMEK